MAKLYYRSWTDRGENSRQGDERVGVGVKYNWDGSRSADGVIPIDIEHKGDHIRVFIDNELVYVLDETGARRVATLDILDS